MAHLHESREYTAFRPCPVDMFQIRDQNRVQRSGCHWASKDHSALQKISACLVPWTVFWLPASPSWLQSTVNQLCVTADDEIIEHL
jgi:hypothetical protein